MVLVFRHSRVTMWPPYLLGVRVLEQRQRDGERGSGAFDIQTRTSPPWLCTMLTMDRPSQSRRWPGTAGSIR
jgi:hypothetical protein